MTDAPIIYWHADDYGMTECSDRRIEACRDHLCSVSIVPNGDAAGAVRRALAGGLIVSLHINLVEGKALTEANEIPLLARVDGSFCNSFGGLLKLSLSGKRSEFARQLELELRAQLRAFANLLPNGTPLRLDSHQHVHMIPLVYRTLMQAVEAEGLNVQYMRIPAEPMRPFVHHVGLWRTYSAINVVKQIVLKGCWLLIKPDFKRRGIETAVFCGILFSGHMDDKRLERVLPELKRIAIKRGQALEVLFHPGGIKPGEPLFDPQKPDFAAFYHSPDREIEGRALCTLGKNTAHERREHYNGECKQR